MLTTTFKQLRRFNACSERYDYLSESLGGVGEYGDKTPITLGQVFDICGRDNVYWLIGAHCRQERIDGKRPNMIIILKELDDYIDSTKEIHNANNDV